MPSPAPNDGFVDLTAMFRDAGSPSGRSVERWREHAGRRAIERIVYEGGSYRQCFAAGAGPCGPVWAAPEIADVYREYLDDHRMTDFEGGCVYFLQDGSTGLIKIGKAASARRIRGLRSQTPTDLRLLHAEPGGFGEEARYHRRFAADRDHGEWFRASPALLDWIAQRREGVAAADSFRTVQVSR